MTSPPAEEEGAEFHSLMEGYDPRERLAAIEDAAKAVLRRAGLPDHAGPVVVEPDGTFREVRPDDSNGPPKPSRTARVTALVENGSTEWYAAHVVWHMANLRNALQKDDLLKKDDLLNVLDHGMEVQRWYDYAAFEDRFHYDVEAAQKCRQGASEGGKARSEAARNAGWVAFARQKRRESPTRKISELAMDIQTKTKRDTGEVVHRKTIQNVLYRAGLE